MSQSGPPSKGIICLAIVIITVGIGWLLTSIGYAPDVNWVLTLGLAITGVLAFIVSGGLDKVSVVVGPFFLVGSILSILRQQGRLKLETEVPILVILIGVLLLFTQSSRVRIPRWLLEQQPPAKRD